ncbi:uncharacterized protein LOC114532763 [Dendronephthya gigantea]|uniref:uncharacterized protein LOC114532763 n=1 Tax=Dendronephthya gigantea TaxID=151771 RepID=UPI00106C097B|nr:uncharacterized protein LOC114532763 [Dendronephthya gigantea]
MTNTTAHLDNILTKLLKQSSQTTPGVDPNTTWDVVTPTTSHSIYATSEMLPHSTPDSIHLTTPCTTSHIEAKMGIPGGVSITTQKANDKSWRLFANTFESSFTGSPQREPDSLTLSSHLMLPQKDFKDDITWNDSDSEEERLSSAKTESPVVLSQDGITLSTHHTQSSQASVNIDDFDSDHETCTDELINKESSPSISSNTPTPPPSPTFTPCTPNKKVEICPPHNSTKKQRQKYFRGGLAERLHKLTIEEHFYRTFWHHQMQQKRDNNDESPSAAAAGDFVRVRVLSETLDHNVYIVRCHVLSHDSHLPEHVIVLLDRERRKTLENNITGSLRIYAPWKLVHLPTSSQTVIMNMAHCEFIPCESLDFTLHDISNLSLEDKKANIQETHSAGDGDDIDRVLSKENERQKEQTVVNWPLQDFLRDERVSMSTRVNLTARVQRIFWRSVEVKTQDIDLGSSWTSQIIQSAKLSRKKNRMSLCYLMQGVTGSYCEVQISEDILVNRKDWHEVLCRSEGTVLSFSQLRLIRLRNRDGARQMFNLIDALKETSAEDQLSFFTFTFDECSSIEAVSQNNISDYPGYITPEYLNVNISSSAPRAPSRRVKVYGNLLHAKFTSDKFDRFKHFLLWVSGRFFAAQDGAKCDLASTVSVIQVHYFSGRTVEWNETTLLPGQLLSIQDLVYDKAKPKILTADIFSKIQLVFSQSFIPCYDQQLSEIHQFWRQTMTVFMTEKEYTCLKSQPLPVLPNLSENCVIESLVILEGTISGVDKENAFCWFSCPNCSSECISEPYDSDSQYQCNSCLWNFNSPVTNMNLEVYIRSRSLPALNPKVKLLQRSINELLSGSQKDSQETYQVDCVLNKHLGPLYCCIVEKTQDENSEISFKLEELDSSAWGTRKFL